MEKELLHTLEVKKSYLGLSLKKTLSESKKSTNILFSLQIQI